MEYFYNFIDHSKLSFLTLAVRGILLNAFVILAVYGGEACDLKLPEAEAQYKAGYYDAAIQLLEGCLANNGFSDEDKKIKAYSILARAYLVGDCPVDKIQDAIYKLLDLDSDYQPNTPENPKFENLVKAEKERRQKIARSHKKWYWIGGGATLVSVGIIVYAVTRPEEEKELPGPPITP